VYTSIDLWGLRGFKKYFFYETDRMEGDGDALKLFNISSPSQQCIDAYMRKRTDGRGKTVTPLA